MSRARARGCAPRRCVVAAALLAAIASSGAARAHTQLGSLGEPAASTDFYQVTCSDDGSGAPASLALQLLDTAPAVAALVSVQVQRGAQAATATDPVDGDATPSPLLTLDAAAGVFDVLVFKTASGSESYSLTFHCTTGPAGTGDHTGTSVTTRQNQ